MSKFKYERYKAKLVNSIKNDSCSLVSLVIDLDAKKKTKEITPEQYEHLLMYIFHAL